jgi:DNA-binding beta-propeller fold protein YncE
MPGIQLSRGTYARAALLTVAAITALVSVACLVTATRAEARSLYVANGLSAGPGSLSQFDLGAHGQPLPIDPPTVDTGDGPQHVAFTPDGHFAYATAAGSGQLFAFRVESSGRLTPLDPPAVATGLGAHGVVVSPDGRSAYVGNQTAGSVTQYDIAADGTLTAKSPAAIVSGSGESGLAMTPNGSSAYVTNLTDNSVGQFAVNRATGALSQKPRSKVLVPAAPSGLAAAPDGRSLYVATLGGNIFQFTILRNGALRRKDPAKVKAGLGASGVAITADGRFLYTPNSGRDSVSQFRISPRDGTLKPLRPASIPVGERPEGVAVAPDGRSLYVAIAGADQVRWLTIGRAGRLKGQSRSPRSSSPGPHGLAVSPDQSPVAALDSVRGGVVGRKLTLRAQGSYDPDGRVARYRWRFGDGRTAVTSRPKVAHRYRRPGSFVVRLSVVDDEGCSSRRIYTGQSALCSGGPSKTWTRVPVRRRGGKPNPRLDGALKQLRGPGGCVVDESARARRCVSARGLKEPGPFLGSRGIVISPDGKNAYVASSGSDAIAIFSRNRKTGVLTQPEGQAGCVSADSSLGCAPAVGLEGPASVAVSPDGATVYSASVDSDSLTAFSRDSRTGALTQLPGSGGCVSELSIAGCGAGRGLDGADTVAVSPDGKNVYAGAFQGSAIAVFDRDGSGALTQPPDEPGCLTAAATPGCATAAGIKAVESLTVSPDGSRVFAAGAASSAVTSFDRDSSGGLAQSAQGCISTPAPAGCALGRGLLGANAVEASPDGSSLYAVSAIGSSVTAFDVVSGGIEQPPGPRRCLGPSAKPDCPAGNGMEVPEAVTVSPDGRNIYLASFESWAVVSLVRSGNGGFRQIAGRAGCVSPASDGCGTGRRLAGAAGIAISPDGRFVYVTSALADAVTVFRRASD